MRQEFYFPTIFWYIERNKLFFDIYTSVVYVKTVIHLSIDESGGIFTEWRGGELARWRGKFPPLLTSTSVIIVRYDTQLLLINDQVTKQSIKLAAP